MEDLIMKIIDIEDRAQEVIMDAREADRQLENRLKDEGKKLEKDIAHRMEVKSATLRHIEDEDADKKIEAINTQTEEQIAALEAKYTENKDKWVNQIVENIIAK